MKYASALWKDWHRHCGINLFKGNPPILGSNKMGVFDYNPRLLPVIPLTVKMEAHNEYGPGNGDIVPFIGIWDNTEPYCVVCWYKSRDLFTGKWSYVVHYPRGQ